VLPFDPGKKGKKMPYIFAWMVPGRRGTKVETCWKTKMGSDQVQIDATKLDRVCGEQTPVWGWVCDFKKRVAVACSAVHIDFWAETLTEVQVSCVRKRPPAIL